MRSILEKKGSVAELPAFFQVMLVVIVFAGLTFIVADKFLDASYTPATASVNLEDAGTINDTVGHTLTASTVKGFSNVQLVALYNDTSTAIGTGNATVVNGVLLASAEDLGLTDVFVNYTYSYDKAGTGTTAINDSTNALFDYGIGFLGIIILVVMVYLIIQIVSGQSRRR